MGEDFDAEAYTSQSKQSWTTAAPHYDRITADLFPPITEAFLKFLELTPGQLALDVACGPGTLTQGAASVVGTSGRVVGIDLSPGMLKIAASRATAFNIEYREMNAEQLDFPDALFDHVFSQLGLMLFARPKLAMTEMARVCKKGGFVSCLVQGSPEKMQFTSLLMKAMMTHAPQIKQPGAPTLYAFAPPGVLEAAMAEGGLGRAQTRRLEGVFLFDSPAHYWTTMVEGAGRTGALLRSLSAEVRAAVEADTLAAAGRLIVNGKVAMPYEVVMARAQRP